jgi:DNA polymerase-1
MLLKHNVLEKLVSTYTEGLIELPTMPHVFTTYNQIVEDVNGNERGISTNRLSSSRPNLQQVPTRTDEGMKIRELFIPSKGKILIDADFSQIELRLLAHFTKDRLLLSAFREGKDLHTETAKVIFNKPEVTDSERHIAKTFSFAILYGAQKEKIAKTIKTSVEEAERLLANYWRALPSVISWVNRTKYEARVKRGVFTLNKRWIPLPGITSQNKWEVMSWERKAVNYVIQGSAAELLKLSLIKLWETGYKVLLTVHDEFLIECDREEEKDKIKTLLENIVTLDVPLVADIGTGLNWKEAKQ